MVVFGTIGLFVRNIDMPSSIIAFIRGSVGALFLILFCLMTKKKFSFSAVKEKLLLLCLSGGAIGVNWILLFEAYRYTTVATATLCYYMAPIFVIVMSLERQIRKNKTRLEKKLREGAFLNYVPDEEYDEEEEFDIRVKSFPVKPMSVEEAILQMNLLKHQFYVFRDAETEEVCVVYARKNGGYGLIVPE